MFLTVGNPSLFRDVTDDLRFLSVLTYVSQNSVQYKTRKMIKSLSSQVYRVVILHKSPEKNLDSQCHFGDIVVILLYRKR